MYRLSSFVEMDGGRQSHQVMKNSVIMMSRGTSPKAPSPMAQFPFASSGSTSHYRANHIMADKIRTTWTKLPNSDHLFIVHGLLPINDPARVDLTSFHAP